MALRPVRTGASGSVLSAVISADAARTTGRRIHLVRGVPSVRSALRLTTAPTVELRRVSGPFARFVETQIAGPTARARRRSPVRRRGEGRPATQ